MNTLDAGLYEGLRDRRVGTGSFPSFMGAFAVACGAPAYVSA